MRQTHVILPIVLADTAQTRTALGHVMNSHRTFEPKRGRILNKPQQPRASIVINTTNEKLIQAIKSSTL